MIEVVEVGEVVEVEVVAESCWMWMQNRQIAGAKPIPIYFPAHVQFSAVLCIWYAERKLGPQAPWLRTGGQGLRVLACHGRGAAASL